MNADAGLTLIEVLVAAFLIGIALVPIMHLYPVALEVDEQIETGLRIGQAASRKMEEIASRLRADINAVTSGSETCSDVPSCRVEWTVATEASSGTQGVGALKTISVTACVDRNGNSACGTDETPVSYDAKVTSRP